MCLVSNWSPIAILKILKMYYAMCGLPKSTTFLIYGIVIAKISEQWAMSQNLFNKKTIALAKPKS